VSFNDDVRHSLLPARQVAHHEPNALRANAGPHEHGLVNGFNAQMMATFARG